MKKKLMSFLVGVLAISSFVHAQTVGSALQPGSVSGQITYTNSMGSGAVTQGQVLPLGTIVTYQGQQYAIALTPAPNNNNQGDLIVGVFIIQNLFANGSTPAGTDLNVHVGLAGGMVANFGTSSNGVAGVDYTLVAIPFDLSTTSILAAGAFIAIVTARRRKKQLGMIA